jgi:hypothetical protein
MESAPTQTVRMLLDELADEIRYAQGTTEDLGTCVLGPRPVGNDNAKDPRSDMRSSIERLLARMRELNADLARVNNGLGIPSNRELVGRFDESPKQMSGTARSY